MNRREFLIGAAAAAGAVGCTTSGAAGGKGGRFLFGVCRGPGDVKLLKSVGYDFWEWNVGAALDPDKDDAWWKRQRDFLRGQPLPLRSCNGFIPGKFRLTGPKADFAPALAYAEKALRRADEIGVKTVVFGSGGARNVPGDFAAKTPAGWPDAEKGTAQYAEFCRLLCARVADLKTTSVVIEPLRPKESNIVNYVWQGLQIVNDVKSPRLEQLADLFHMMMGRECPKSIVFAGAHLKHCHIAEYGTRAFPGADPSLNDRYRPYMDALREIGYAGGISCECGGWGKKEELGKNLETALKTLNAI